VPNRMWPVSAKAFRLEDEVAKQGSQSGRPMFGEDFSK
jgi:hypothetical protein